MRSSPKTLKLLKFQKASKSVKSSDMSNLNFSQKVGKSKNKEIFPRERCSMNFDGKRVSAPQKLSVLKKMVAKNNIRFKNMKNTWRTKMSSKRF